MTSEASRATRAVRTAIESDTQHGAVVPPLHLSSNYAFAGFGEKRQYDYTRSGNPTRDALGEALTTLEGGAGAVVTASGMAALNVMVQLLKPGDLLVVPHDCYGGTYRLYEALGRKGHFEVLFVDQTDERALADACARGPRLILTETPSNPLLRIVDIARVSALAKDCGALYAVDNTFLSPALQQEELTWWANCIGATGAPFDSFLTLRGLRTLQVRMRQHEETASSLARVLDEQAAVRQVYYPGLESHPGHDIARRQQCGFGGMISFEINGGEQAVRAFVDQLQYFSLAESLGGVESLVCHPPSMTHAPVSAKALKEAGISQSLIRLSVGLEAVEDLVDDVLRGLAAASAALAPEPVAVVG
jgi:cystathionine gamma-synthase